MKKSLLLFLSVLCACLCSCRKTQSNSLLEQVKAKGELVIALEGNWVPWGYHNAQDQLVGFDVEVATEMCRRIGVRPKFVEVEWERLLSGLEKNECDIVINGVAITPERQERFYYTEPYAFAKNVLIVRKDNNDIKSFEDLAGKTSANSKESTHYEIAKKYGAISIVVDTFDETMNLLLQNRVDSTINTFFSYYAYIKENPNAPIKIAASLDNSEQIAIPCKRNPNNLTFLLTMNNILETMRSDGTLSQLSMKYFEQDITK